MKKKRWLSYLLSFIYITIVMYIYHENFRNFSLDGIKEVIIFIIGVAVVSIPLYIINYIFDKVFL